jgi:hypothetical protein
MNKLKNLLPAIIFIITISLGIFSIIYSLKIVKKAQPTGEILWSEGEDGEDVCGAWGFAGNVYCQDKYGPLIRIPTGQVRYHAKFSWDDDSTTSGGPINIRNGHYEIKGDLGIKYAKGILERLYVTQLAETVTYTLPSRVILDDGRIIPAGTYTVETSKMQGPQNVTCKDECFAEERVPPRPNDPGDCSTPTEYRNCDIFKHLHQFDFKYTNCWPQASPSPSPSPSPTPVLSFVCEDLTRQPNTQLEIGDEVYFTCSHTPQNTQLDHYEFRWSADEGTTYTNLELNNTSGTSGPHRIEQAGDYIVQCRACATEGHNQDGSTCTNWGQDGGWEPGPYRP